MRSRAIGLEAGPAANVPPAETVASVRPKGAADAKAEADRARDIRGLAKAYGAEDRERYWISAGVSVDAVRAEILDGICASARPTRAAWMPLMPESEPEERQRRGKVHPRTLG